MDILKITPQLWELIEVDNSPIEYAGRYQYNLGLGNPYSHINGSQVQYITKTRKEAVEKYKEWLTRLINRWMHEGKGAMFGYEKDYLMRVLALAQRIRNHKVTALATYDFHAINYQPVADGEEQSHAEVLYKECLRINDFCKQRT